jgi:hypothetical protein|tara:strand:+ start:903 stop:1157 length:255 start_codon:yes stop_codon:yes gene_type:complete
MKDKKYILYVQIDGEEHTLLTYATTPEGAIDNAVMLDGVEELYKIVEEATQEEYAFDINIQEIRKIRKLLPSDMTMDFKLNENG